MKSRMLKNGIALGAALVVLCGATGASAEGLPYRGTSFTLGNTVTALTLAPGAELTYNPTYVMNWRTKLSWWFNDMFFVSGDIRVARELTSSDYTTYAGEFEIGDASLQVGASNFYTLPGAEINFGAVGELTLPTSKASLGDTLVAGAGLSLSADRSFSVLEGLSLSYTFSPARSFHRFTTGELATPMISDCTESPESCSRFLNNGSRNVSWSMGHDLSASMAFTKWASLAASIGTITGFLYERTDVDSEMVSYAVENPSNERYLNYYRLAATFSPYPSFDIVLGTSTVNPQLSPSSTYYPPLFNRYTRLFVDIRLNMAGFMKQLKTATEPATPIEASAS